MTNDSTGEKIKEKVMETKDKVKETVGETVGMGEKGTQGIKDKVKETIGMGAGEGGGNKRKEGQLGPGAEQLNLKKRLQRQAQIAQQKEWKALERL